MKVNVAVVGRFHAFDLAYQFKKRNILNKLVTTYPKYIAERWGIPPDQVVSELLLEIINRFKRFVPFVSDDRINKFIKVIHAKNSAMYLSGCDIHIGWSGSSLETIIKAKKNNKLVILERGSSHYSFQMKILKEENSICNNLSYDPNYLQWERELLEYELADYISIPSSFVKSTFLEYGVNEEKLILNPYGVNLREFKQVSKDDDVFRIIFAGGGEIRKGYHYLLQAFYELDLPNCELWHLGCVGKEIKPYLDKYKHKNWILKGHQPQSELYTYYSQGSVFIMPSIEDGFAMVQFQAMACGLPLICTTNTGGEDLITNDGEEGFVIPIRDVGILKEKILYLYDNPIIAKEMGKKAKIKVHNGFSWDDYGSRYVENLRKITSSNEY